jgi:hypothetical protein
VLLMSNGKAIVLWIAVMGVFLWWLGDYNRNHPATTECQQAIRRRRELGWPGGMDHIAPTVRESARRDAAVTVVEECK